MQVPWERPVGRRREAGGGTSWQPGGGAGPVPKAHSRVSRISCVPKRGAKHQMHLSTQMKQVIASVGLPKRSDGGTSA